ncbi:MAG TPA: hypothetical protein VMP01_20800 [Pirellulaceae bacterium]|nr:hypothetical protein [Pirellulaceae bacterium]
MFDIHQDPFFDDEGDELDVEVYQRGLFREFLRSPEGKACIDEIGDAGMVDAFLYDSLAYQCVSPASARLDDIGQILFTHIPCKVSIEPEEAGTIIRQLRYFWQFLDRAYRLPLAAKVLNKLNEKAIGRLERELADPRNWGMAKSLVMSGREAGYDMTSKEGCQAFMAAYNASLLQRPTQPAAEPEPDDPYFAPTDYEPQPKRSDAYLRPSYSSPDERRRANKERQKKLKSLMRRRR